MRVSHNATLRPAGGPGAGPLPFGPLGLALGALAGTALWLALARLGVPRQVAQRPAAAAVSLVLVAALLPRPAKAGGLPTSFGDSGNAWVTRWVIHDALGSAILYTNADGEAVKRRVFEPFGQIAAESMPNTETTERRFTGQRFEEPAGLYDFGARWYDPEVGRFLSVDPVVRDPYDPQTVNAYSYVENNPINRVDPTGKSSWGSYGFSATIDIAFYTLPDGRFAVEVTYSQSGSGQSANALSALLVPVGIPAALAEEMTLGGELGSLGGPEGAIAGALIGLVGGLIYDYATGGPITQQLQSTLHRPQVVQQNADDDASDYTDKPGKIAKETGKSVDEVEKAIHRVKEGMSRDTEIRNPNVKVNPKTGDARPVNPDGTLGDSIGNIFDFL